MNITKSLIRSLSQLSIKVPDMVNQLTNIQEKLPSSVNSELFRIRLKKNLCPNHIAFIRIQYYLHIMIPNGFMYEKESIKIKEADIEAYLSKTY